MGYFLERTSGSVCAILRSAFSEAMHGHSGHEPEVGKSLYRRTPPLL